MSKIYRDWCFLGDDLAFRDFCWLNFPTITMRGDKLKYFGKLILDLFRFYTCKGFSYLFTFLDI